MRLLIIWIVCSSAAAQVLAGDLPYTYLDLRQTTRGLDTIFRFDDGDAQASLDGDTGSGLGLAASVRVHRNLYLAAEYSDGIDIPLKGVLTHEGVTVAGLESIESRYARLSLGFRSSLTRRLDLGAELGTEYVVFLFPGTLFLTTPSGASFGLSEVGVEKVNADVKLGLRLLLGERLEFSAHGRYSQLQLGTLEIGDGGELALNEDVLLGLGATLYLGEKFGAGAGYEAGDAESFNIFLRFRI